MAFSAFSYIKENREVGLDVISQNSAKLKVGNLSLSFGSLHALNDVSLEVRQNNILAIIGPNGAGKTCMLNCINGFYHPQKGDIFFDGKAIT